MNDKVIWGPNKCLGTAILSFRRLLLESAGPLPQYHPRFLAALLLSGKYTAAAAVLQRLAAWLIALRQHEDTAKAAGEVALHHPPSPGVHVALTAAGSDGNADSSDLPAPLFSSELVENPCF